ncbi:OB-fold containing protein, partial [Dehalococcoides mccartyi]
SIVFSISTAFEGKVASSPTGNTDDNTQVTAPIDDTSTDGSVDLTITAETLYSHYVYPGETNPDLYYKSKNIKITGKVAGFVYGTVANSCWISFKTDQSNGANVICYFGNYVIKPGAAITIGMDIEITGTCMGLTNGHVTLINSFTDDIQLIPYDHNLEA